MGVMLANVVGAPLAAGLLSMNGLGGLRGWQWLFLLEGLPSIILGVLIWFVLPDQPLDARCLTQDERLTLHMEVSSWSILLMLLTD